MTIVEFSSVILAIALAALLEPQAAVRERWAERDAVAAAALSTISFPGYDATDNGAVESAIYFCGPSDECRQKMIEARDLFVRTVALEGRQKPALKIVAFTSSNGHTDWRQAYIRYVDRYHPPVVERGPVSSIRCYSIATKRSVATSCYSY